MSDSACWVAALVVAAGCRQDEVVQYLWRPSEFEQSDRTSASRRLLMGSLCLLLLAACGNEEASCLDEEIADCQPLYEPTFDNVFNRSLQGKCAVSGACHSGESAKAGLRFDEIDASYSALMAGERVLEGDASCSLLSRRLEGQGGSMPPGNPLSEAERCAIHQWIQEGAKR